MTKPSLITEKQEQGMPQPSKQSGKVNYIVIIIVAILAIAGGRLLAQWLAIRYAMHQIENTTTVIQTQANAFIEKNNQRIEAERQRQVQLREARQQQKRTERASTRTGRSLAISCQEWQDTNQRYDSYTAKQEMQKACDSYERYLDTGIAPTGVLK